MTDRRRGHYHQSVPDGLLPFLRSRGRPILTRRIEFAGTSVDDELGVSRCRRWKWRFANVRGRSD